MRFVPFQPVHRRGEQLAASREPVPPEAQESLRQVLRFYDVPFRTSDQGELLIPETLTRDLDTLWNYTTKANDPAWLRAHRSG